ncbi:MAG: LysR family transcriptional regulator [Alphaproteobacteria bacterium]|nr:LysR family transcriptional regulator [Alphaproteobacteria bacterium]
MKPSLAQGLATSRRFEVDKDRTISFMGEEGRVYATPSMVRDIEQTCRDFLLTHLDAGEDSVGTRVEFDHMAATPLGMPVEFSVTIAEVQGRAVTFEVTGKDAIDQICRGKHWRFVVDVAKTAERIKAKAAKAKG